jgi:hypothetical protein
MLTIEISRIKSDTRTQVKEGKTSQVLHNNKLIKMVVQRSNIPPNLFLTKNAKN